MAGARRFLLRHQADLGGRRAARAVQGQGLCPAAPQAAAWWSRTIRPSSSASRRCWVIPTSRSSSAGTGAEALEMLREKPVDCVVLDLRLPDISGFELLEKLSADPALADIPVIVFTGRELTAGRGRPAAFRGAQHRGQGRGIARAAAGRNRAVPAPRGHRPAARKAADAGEADQLGRRSGRHARCCWWTTTPATSSRCPARWSAAACRC